MKNKVLGQAISVEEKDEGIFVEGIMLDAFGFVTPKRWRKKEIAMLDPRTGKLYDTLDEALDDGAENPVEVVGRQEDLKYISETLMKAKEPLTKKQKKLRAKNKRAKESRKKNRGK